MIQTIRIGHLLREAVAAPYRNLVTRPTGAAVRIRIEATLADSNCLTALLDFSEIELVDLSCADEVVAKLLLTVRTAYFVVLQGLREDHHEAIDHVLTHHRLAVAAVPPGSLRPPAARLGAGRCAGGVRPHLRARARSTCADLSPRHWAGPQARSREALGDLTRQPPGATHRRAVLPAPDRMSRPGLGLSTIAIHGTPHRRPDWSPVAPVAAPEQHLRQSDRHRTTRCSTAATATTPTR